MAMISWPPGRRRAAGALAALTVFGVLVGVNRGAPPARAASDPVLLAAGDVASCQNTGDEATAGLLRRDPGAVVAMLGDGAYETGKASSDLEAYQACYSPSWGQPDLTGRTRPATGDNDYADPAGNPGAGGYFDYFDGVGADDGPAGPRPLGYYSYNIGAWHVVVLNSQCDPTKNAQNTPLDGCGADSSMGKWLKADLAPYQNACVLAYWHQPRFFSFTAVGPGPYSGNLNPDSDPTMNAMWRILQDNRADVVLNAHRHAYERFPKLVLPSRSGGGPGVPDPVNGIREFVVGTGGGPREHFLTDPATGAETNLDPNSEQRIGKTFGVLRLTLRTGGYDWQFLGTATKASDAPAVLDSGSDTCNGGPAPTTTSSTPPASGPADPPAARSGYWMASVDGRVYGFGDAAALGDAPPSPGAQTVDIEPTPTGDGYWVVDSVGRVTPLGAAPGLGSVPAGILAPGETVTSLSATRSGKGYWIFTSRGRVVPLGDAVSYGDLSRATLNGPVLDSVPTPSGRGYYMVASDGGIFAFGDAVFRGSMGGRRLNAPVQSLVPVPTAPGASPRTAEGYWLVASDGGVFAFDAPFRGSMGATRLNRPITGMVPYGDGYLMVGDDGGIFDFSHLPFAGSLGANPPPHPIVSVAALP